MKKLALFFTCITLSFFLLNNCSESSNPTLNENISQDQFEKRKPKPPIVEASIVNLTVAETILIDNDNLHNEVEIEDPTTHPVFNLELLPFDIHYEIKSSVEIQNVRLELRYDANVNSDYMKPDEGDDFWLEKTEVAFNDWGFINDGDIYTHNVSWDGDVYDRKWYPLFDKLATYDIETGEVPITDPDGMDHYLLSITAFSDAPSVIVSKTAYVWITGAITRSLELFIENIQITTTETSKNKTIPKAIITLCNNVQNSFIYGRWEGLSNNSALYSGPSVNGVIIVYGDSFSKRTIGELSFKVTNIQHQDGVYNPWLNTEWEWPNRPMIIVKYPY